MVYADARARIGALTCHERSLLVEAGAGSGKTALMAGRVALLVAAGIAPKHIAAITFTEAAAAELLERIERIVNDLGSGEVPVELKTALPTGLSDAQRASLEAGARALDELTCTTIHGFCQKLIGPYPVETDHDPGAAIIDPAAAELAYQDLMEAWLSARFGRDRSKDGLGRVPPIENAGTAGDDFFAALLLKGADDTLDLIKGTAQFLKEHRTAGAAAKKDDRAASGDFVKAVDAFAAWYDRCGVVEPDTAALIADLRSVADNVGALATHPVSGRCLAELLFHPPPSACKKGQRRFKQWRARTKWKAAVRAVGESAAQGEQLYAAGQALYGECEQAYGDFCNALGARAFERFIVEFDALRGLYRDYKRNAALLDFDDLLYLARDLLRDNEPVRKALAGRYSHILVDEFQDTDPLQAEIIWRLAGEGSPQTQWYERAIRPGALFLVGDPKQAIYRFRGAEVQTYLTAKYALSKSDPASVLSITANFRSRKPILNYVNAHFERMLGKTRGQPGFTALTATRDAGDEPGVAALDITLDDRHRNARGKLLRDKVREKEALVVADTVKKLIGSYPVYDRGETESRFARPGDIALLAPTGTGLWIYEQALEDRDIPIATQAGKGFFRRQEVQDLIAVARTIADARDTLAFGALIRGPLVGLSEEQIADEVEALHAEADGAGYLNVRTDPRLVRSDVLRHTLTVLQNLVRKGRRTTPYHLLAEAVEELHVRPILKARHPRGAERALANVELVLEMARAYAGRGIGDFARALWQRWNDGDTQVEGRPDAAADAVSIITMHSAKGLEWPIVIPINSTTRPATQTQFLYRRRDDSVHFRIFDFPSPEYERVKVEENAELGYERVRLWYVALTRARDLLLLPRQNERIEGDWLSLIDIDIESLPPFDTERFDGTSVSPAVPSSNVQDAATWKREARVIAANQRQISWHRPSRQDDAEEPEEAPVAVFANIDAGLEATDEAADEFPVRGGLGRGLILHKLMEEVLTGETAGDAGPLQARADELIVQQQLEGSRDESSAEMAATVVRTLQLPEIAALRPRLVPEFRVYASAIKGATMSITAGIADAVAMDEDGQIDVVVDWKSDVDLRAKQVAMYRKQVRDYLKATAAKTGLIVFLGSDHIETVVPGD